MTDRVCKVDECTSPPVGRGWCNKHYRRWKRTGDPLKVAWERGDISANFWSKVRRGADDACWPWTGYVNEDGYGKFVWPDGQLAHRFAYADTAGDLSPLLDVDHRCHSESRCTATGRSCPHRRCANPAHLVAIEPDEHKSINKPGARGSARGAEQRAKTHCPRNHPYDEANTYIDKRGCRNCRACRRKTTQKEL